MVTGHGEYATGRGELISLVVLIKRIIAPNMVTNPKATNA
jgi:hypothetical protein